MNDIITKRLKLPAVSFGLMFFCGCLTGCICGGEFAWILALAALAVAAVCFALHRGQVWAVGLALGLAAMTGYFQLYSQPLEQLAGSSVRTELRILSTREYASGWSSSTAACVLNGIPTTIYLSGTCSADAGDSIDALVSLEKAPQNTYSFSDGVVLSGEVVEVCSTQSNFSLLYYADQLRVNAAKNLEKLGGDEAELCKGILLGDTSGFSLKLRRDITYSGVNYMTAVSGAHLTLCVMILTELFGKKRPRLTAGISVAAAVLLALFFGFTPSVMRAGIMLIVCRAGVMFSRRADPLNSLCIALLLLTFFTPNAAADPALQMSALGVFGTAILGNAVCGLRKFGFERFRLLALIKQAAVLSLCAVVCIAPVSVSLFGGISLAEIPASVALSPFFTAALVLGLPAMCGFPVYPALNAVMGCFRGIIAFFGEMDWAWQAMDYTFAVPLTLFTAVALIAAAFSQEHSKQGLQIFGLSLVLVFFVNNGCSACRSRVDFVSDGKTGAAVISSGSQSAVIISGDAASLGFTLYDQLLRSGCSRLTLINAPQLDYRGLSVLSEVTELFPTETLLCPQELLPLAESMFTSTELRPAAVALSVNGSTIACAKSGEEVSADIVIYYGYTKTKPESTAGLAAYASKNQKLLPENGVNIYENRYRIELDG
ncbi:MAG: ComEC/Rec2 family competence protein [Oscillospiraceae bacterium]